MRRSATARQIHRWAGLVGIIGLFLGSSVSSGWGQELEWQAFGEALSEADTSGHPVLVHVYAPWCGWCRKMETDVYPSDGVRDCLDQFVRTRLNRDDNETTHVYRGRRLTSYRLATMLRADAVPTVVLLASDGRYLLHLPGFVEPRLLQTVLAYVATEAYRDTSFETFRAEGAGACEEL